MESRNRRGREILFRDLIIFQIKLFLDGLKDIVTSQIALGAAVIDFLAPGPCTGRRFYAVMGMAERFDRWLSLYGAAEKAAADEDGLFGASKAGTSTLLGRIEEWLTGRIEVDAAEGDAHAAG